MRIVVTGGGGGLGRQVMSSLATRGAPGVSVSRRSGVDLRTGKGLDAALEGSDVVIHAASLPTRYRAVDLDGTRRMVEILSRQRQRPHVIYVSIVGCDLNPYPYYRAKHACEIVLRRSGLPVTVVRATQFHALVATLARALTVGSTAFVPRGLAAQPCSPAWVASQVTDYAVGEAPDGYRRAPDLAGPERLTLAEAVALVARRDARVLPRLVTLPAVGGTLRSFAAGSNLPGPRALVGGQSFSAWLAG